MNDQTFESDFAAFILTHGRPDRVYTYKTLRKQGYKGKIYIVIDDLDKCRNEYVKQFGDKVVVFDKVAVSKTFDTADNFNDMRAIVYARNACFQIARDLGLKYFIQLDDDYTNFAFRFNDKLEYKPGIIKKSLGRIFKALLKFYIQSGCDSIAIAQGGDFIGGKDSALAKEIMTKRKAMNSFICSVDRPFQFVGRVNEDVNTYTHKASQGLLMLTINQISLLQKITQTNSGGMTEMYLDSGTYVKSFYSVMFHPSGVRIGLMGNKNKRLHHSISWDNTAPVIVSEDVRKPRNVAEN